MSETATAARTFLPGVGFRRSGLRLAHPATATQGERTVTVTDVIATREATDVVFEVTTLASDRYAGGPPRERVGLRVGEERFGLGGGMGIAVRAGKMVHTYTLVPISSDVRHIDFELSGEGVGEWRIPLELAAFPAPGESPYREVGASDTRHGITVTVRGVVFREDLTALDLIVLGGPDVTVHGLGGMRMRNATTALTLRDDKGRTFPERFRQDARDQFPDPSGIADVGIFDPLPDDADVLVLEVPSAVYDDAAPRAEIDLPVIAPRDVQFAGRTIRILSSEPTTMNRGPNAPSPAIALRLDLGSTADELCVIKPSMITVDGQPAGIGFGRKGIHGPSPEPLEVIEVAQTGDEAPKRVMFSGATVRARGPWRIEFARPR